LAPPPVVRFELPASRSNGETVTGQGGGKAVYPSLRSWNNADFQDEWKFVDDQGHLVTD
jgi:hypothetical protein